MAAGGHFRWPKITFDRISHHLRSIHNFFFTKQLSAAILDDRISIAFLAISDQYATFFFTKWLPAAILDDRKSLSIAFLAISDQYATCIYFFHTKWLPATILDDRKSLSKAFLAISDQYATFFYFEFFSKWPPSAILEVRFGPFWMTENHFRSHFSPFQINTQLFEIFFKMAAGGHFGITICAKNNRILPLCVINGYAKYEADRWIYDTVRDATSFLSIFVQNGRQRPFCFSNWCQKS